MKRNIHLALKYVLAVGTIGYGVASIARPKRFAELTGMEEATVRELAMRDISSGLQILTAANPTSALIGRAIHDFSDAFKLVRRRPSVAPVAIVWGLLAIAAVLTRTPAPVEAE